MGVLVAADATQVYHQTPWEARTTPARVRAGADPESEQEAALPRSGLDLAARVLAALRPREDAYQRREITRTLREAPGCALCALTERSVARYLDMLSYEHVNDIPLRDHLRHGRGFCNLHGWQMLDQVRDPLGMGIIYRDVVHDVVKTVDRYVRQTRSLLGGVRSEADHAAELARALTPARTCLACDQLRMVDDDNASALARYLDEPEFRATYASAAGVCLWHARQVVARSHADEARAVVRATWTTMAGGLGARLDESAVVAAALAGTIGARDHHQFGWPAGRNGLTLPPLTPAGGGSDAAPNSAGSYPAMPDIIAPSPCPICGLTLAGVATGGFGWGRAQTPGLCSRHASRLPAAVLARTLAEVADSPFEPSSGSLALGLRGLGSASGWLFGRRSEIRPDVEPACPACAEERLLSLAAAESLLASGDLGALGSVCLPHLQQLCLVKDPRGARGPVVAARAESWRVLVLSLLEYIRKQDYRFRHEPRGEEQESPRLAVQEMVGRRWLG